MSFVFLLRIFALVLGAWLVLRILRSALTSKANTAEKKVPQMVRCTFCDTYVPVDLTVLWNNKHFCSKEHMEAYRNQDT